MSILVVTNNNDSGPGSLRQTIMDANSNDIINFDTSITFILLTTGELVISKNLSIIGYSEDASILKISGNNSSKIFSIDATFSVTISNLTITNGSDNTYSGGIVNRGNVNLINVSIINCVGPFGGGIANFSTMIMKHSIISDNTGIGAGGGMVNFNAANAELDNVTIMNCTSGSGAGISNSGTMTINNSIIDNNSCTANGGGVNNINIITINNSTISNNSSGNNGAGIYVIASNSNASINNTIIRNNISNTRGGGIYNASTMSINQSTISTNNSALNGGGITNINGNMTITNSTIDNNMTISTGAGIFSNSNLSIYNSTIYNNTTSSNNGGGISSSGTTTMINCTICNNAGGGCYQTNGTFNIANTIVGNNSAIINPDVSGTFNALMPSYGFNLIGNVGSANGFQIDNIINTPIDVGPFMNNGGPTLTIMPNSTSPAINNGNNEITINNFTPFPQLLTSYGFRDQRGYERFVSNVDIGAVEFNSVPICYSGNSIVLIKNKDSGQISEMMVKNVYSDKHQVFSINDNDFVDILANAITGPTTRYRKIIKNFFAPNQPSTDFYVTGGHKIIVNEQEIKIKTIKNLPRIKCKSEYVYSICIKKRGPILINGLKVIAWAYNDWIQYLNKRGVNWWNNEYDDEK